MDPEQKEILIEVIEKLLADKTTVSLNIYKLFHRREKKNIMIHTMEQSNYIIVQQDLLSD